MLPGRPGRAPTDGVWAPHWYAAVEASTGFEPYVDARAPTVPDRLRGAPRRAAGPTTTSCAAAPDPRAAARPRLPRMLQTFDERNRDLLVNVNGVLRHRDEPHV